jgi:addiction module HigA family antidote
MDRQIQNQYAPDHVSPPGETLLETLEAIGMTLVELAERTGKSPKTINEIVKGIAPITPETALQFERVLGVPARFWNNRERQYRKFLAHREERGQIEKSVDRNCATVSQTG